MKNWIFEELTQAEKAGDKVCVYVCAVCSSDLTLPLSLPLSQVLILAHIPPGDTTSLPEYGEFYLNMTRRFGDTIVGHLFGHTHQDMFELVSHGNRTQS